MILSFCTACRLYILPADDRFSQKESTIVVRHVNRVIGSLTLEDTRVKKKVGFRRNRDRSTFQISFFFFLFFNFLSVSLDTYLFTKIDRREKYRYDIKNTRTRFIKFTIIVTLQNIPGIHIIIVYSLLELFATRGYDGQNKMAFFFFFQSRNDASVPILLYFSHGKANRDHRVVDQQYRCQTPFSSIDNYILVVGRMLGHRLIYTYYFFFREINFFLPKNRCKNLSQVHQEIGRGGSNCCISS